MRKILLVFLLFICTTQLSIAQLSASIGSPTNVKCNGGSDASATVTASGGTGPYTYVWAPSGGNGATASNLSVGTYTVTVTDAASATKSTTVAITQPSALVTATAVTNVACNGGSNGVASITASGGAGSYTYLWSNGGTTSAITGLLAGAYTATVTDANSCTSIKSAIVTQPSALATATAVTTVTCNGGSNGVAAITASGGAGGYTYRWSNGATTSAITGLMAGAYTATVTDANSCTSIKSAIVTQPSALVTSTAVTNVACNGGSNGVAWITASGGTGGYTYLWSNGATTSAITGLLAGTYTATVTDANSCTSIKSARVTQPSALVTSTAVTNVACNGGSNGVAAITASGGAGGYTYRWSNGATTSAITGLMAGAYTATVTDANSCTSIKSAIVTQPSALVTSTAVTNVACNGGSNGVAAITASGGAGSYTYLWSNGGTTSAITGLMAGVYTATVTDANSCTSIKSATVTQPSALVTTTAVTNVACNGGSNGVASITASGGAGGYTYLWSTGATTSAITGLMAGAYTATVTDANSCTSIKSATVTQPSALVTTTAVANVACNGGSNGVAAITASGGAGGYTYRWSTGATTSAITGLLAGAYTATVTDANSCTSIKSAIVTQPSALVTSTAVTNVACNGGSNGVAAITASGGAGSYTYLWSNGGTTSAITGLMAGVYTATVTDANSCTSIKSATVTQPSALVTTTAVTNVACNGGSNGVASITASGGAGGYSYLWSTGASTSSITGRIAGIYTATVTDANGCTSIKSVTVTQPASLVATLGSKTDVTVYGGSDGAATATVSGGTSPYSYLWSNGSSTSSISGLSAGIYTVTATDSKSCNTTLTVTISQPAPSTNATLSGLVLSSGTLTPVFSSGTTTYLASVPNSVSSITITPTVTQSGASVKVNGTTTASGNASSSIPLTVGNNNIAAAVTAEDAITTQTYTISVTRDKFTPTITFNTLSSKNYGDPDFDPAATSNNSSVSVTYSSSNTAVATIVSGKVHIVGAGTSTITASQSGDTENYAAPDVSNTLTVNPKNITLTLNNVPVISKVYDKTTSATLAVGNYSLTGLEDGDVVTVSGTATYDNSNVGTGKTVTANTFVLAGAAKDNYSLSTTSQTTTGAITAKSITLALNSTPVISKTYDKSTPAALAVGNYTLNGLETGDAVTVSGTATYDNVNVGTGKTITANTFVLAGAAKDNYSLSTTSQTTTGAITAKPITLALNSTPVISKAYDKTTSATLAVGNYSLTGLETGDVVTVSGTANYDNANVGTDKTVTANTFVLAGAAKDNYSLSTTSQTTTGAITAKPITLALNSTPVISKTYNKSTTAALAVGNYTLNGLETGDAVTVSGTANYDNANVGTGKTITANTFVLAGTAKDNYSLSTTSQTTTGAITAKSITLALNSTPVISKAYDKSTTATLTVGNYTLNGLETGDAVTVSGTATYDNVNVGTGKTITANTFVLAGTAKDNYSLSTTSQTTTGAITAKPITLALNSTPAISKAYDKTTSATLAVGNYSLTGLETGDVVTVSGTATYDNVNVGTGKTITANTFVLAGAAKDNYSLSTTSQTTTGAITAKPITLALNSSPAISKAYDKTTSATLAVGNYSLTGLETGDVVTVSGTATYDNANVGTGKTVTANTFVLAGTAKDNYSLSTTSQTTTGAITAKPITLALNSTPVISKTYNKSTTATLAVGNYTLNGLETGDVVTVSGNAFYDNANVGTAKVVTANTFVLAGAAKDNYSLSTTSQTTTGAITAKPITLALNSTPVISKTYNKSTTATLAVGNYTLNGLETGDAVTVSGTASYDNANVGTGKTVTANTFVLAGAAKDNYSLSTTSQTTTGAITAKPITLALNSSPAISKAYDKTTSATLAVGNYSLTGLEDGDVVTVSGTATYDNANVGTGKTVTANTFVLAGTAKDNYSLSTTSQTTTGAITAKPITLALNSTPVISKTYNKSTTAALAVGNYTLNGLETGDVVTVSGTATYDNASVGTGKTVTANTFVLAGAAKDNYSLSTVSQTTTGAITAKPITLALNSTPAISKAYDKSTTATLAVGNYTLNGLETGDVVTVSGTATYDNVNVGTGKTITANTFVLAGTAKDNYSLSTTSQTTTGAITAKSITLALNSTPAISKTYDKSTPAALVVGNYTLNGLETGDVVTVSGNAFYDNANVGTAKVVTANTLVLAGSAKDNYSLTTTTTNTTGSITPASLTITADNKEKFVGTANPPLTASYSGFVGGETNNVLAVQPVLSTSVTTATPMGNYPIQVSDASANNYSISYVNGSLTVKPGAPTSVSLTAVTLFENSPAGTLAGNLSSTSDDPNATFTYSLVTGTGSADNSNFTIVNNELRSAQSFDYEAQAQYNVRVRSTTQYGFSLDQTFIVNVSDVNEVPTLAAIANQNICFTATQQTVALANITAGPELNQTTILTASSTNPSLFSSLTVEKTTGTNGVIRYTVAPGGSGTATITVTVKDNGGVANGGIDTFSQTFTLTVNALPVVSISSNIGLTISKGLTAQLTAIGGVSYIWANANGIISGQNTNVLTVRPSINTTYTVTVANASGCTETKTITLNILEDFATISGTNILTPNGDGVNDFLVIRNIDLYPNNEIKIYDLAGRIVYSKKGYGNTWAATLNGSPLAKGTYYYIIDFGDGKAKKKGFVSIVRD